MVSSAVAVIVVFDVAAALGLLVVAAVDRPEGPRALGEALVGAAGAGALALAVTLHGGHLGLPRWTGPGEAVLGTLGALVYLAVLGRAVRSARRRAEV